jgi:trehalose transport system permease protein
MENTFKKFLKKHYFEILLASPLFLYILVLTLYPVFDVIRMSFDANGSEPGYVFGLANYFEIFAHNQFAKAFFNTIFITFVGLSLEVGLGLFIAIKLNQKLKFRGLLRAIYLIPLGIPTIVAAANMRFIFDTNGFLNNFFQTIGIIDIPIDWGAGGLITLMTIVISDMWKVTPLVMLILLAGLQNIPDQIYEAAKIDGATSWQSFKRLTLPLLKPSITMAIVIRGIDCFRIFELPLVLVGKSEPVLATFAYSEYNDALNPYTSAADSVILLVLIIVAIVSYLFISKGTDVVNQ